ncbi:UDP-N-acetylglucosamine 2-epimerase [Rhodanobacter umsongensis]|uniref:UDP-N-acetylglucosamine 2-epimerase n=1 Tax=Rhodanobacter umsongensis TaxID=633153 RepID=A0ABW0JQQ8_9GAMM
MKRMSPRSKAPANFFAFVIGTRAQLIKVAPVIVLCESRGMPICLLMTGQHLETIQDLVDEFGIRTPLTRTVEAMERSTVVSLLRWLPSAYFGLRKSLQRIKAENANFDVIVHGDTLSTLIGAFAGWRVGARVVHLESGLTSGKLFDPFPEELSRRVVFRLVDVAMCPNEAAAAYMRSRHRCRVEDTRGNTILDAIAMVGAMDVARNQKPAYLVVSLHRFQNIYDSSRLLELVTLLEATASKYPIHFVLHPATRKRLIHEKLFERLAAAPGMILSPRLGYGDFLRLAAGAACVMTDGGSNQEELAALGVPTIIMRKATERSDGLGSNAMMEGDISEGVQPFLLKGEFGRLLASPIALVADGPSERVVRALLK